MRRIVINRGTDREVYGRLYAESADEVTIITHMGSLRKFTRADNIIEFPDDAAEPEEKPQSPRM